MTRRRGKGEGSIRQRTDGRWEVRIDLGRGIDGTRRRKSSFAATQAEAIQLLRKLGGAQDERTVDGSRAPRVTGFTRPGPEQLHVLVQQQQPILRRSMVIACAVKADALEPSTLREVVAEFLGDITEAARTIGTILQQAAR
jgi:hypothetical protein